MGFISYKYLTYNWGGAPPCGYPKTRLDGLFHGKSYELMMYGQPLIVHLYIFCWLGFVPLFFHLKGTCLAKIERIFYPSRVGDGGLPSNQGWPKHSRWLPSGKNCYITMENHHFLMGKITN